MENLLEQDHKELLESHQEAARFLAAAKLRRECWSLARQDHEQLNDWQLDRVEELMACPACQVDWFKKMLETTEHIATFQGYDIEQLRSVFSSVTPKDDWRGPIRKVIPKKDLSITCAAIEFFTGTNPFSEYAESRNFVVVGSVGYRNGPCGP